MQDFQSTTTALLRLSKDPKIRLATEIATLMLLTRSLPPQFLLPAWSARQLASAHAVLQQQQRACKSEDTSSTRNKEYIRFDWNRDSPSTGPSSISNIKQTPVVSPRAAKPSALSLFEELFPEESEAKQRAEERSGKLGKSGRLPAFDWKIKTLGDGIKQKVERKKLQEEFKSLQSQVPSGLRAEPQQARYLSNKQAEKGERQRRRESTVLVLNSVMNTLEESDFFRLSPKGEHIEGWTSGIIKGRLSFHCHSNLDLS